MSAALPSNDALLELLVARLADELAPRIAAALGEQLAGVRSEALGTRDLVSLDELVEQLPPAKRPETWKRWLYDHLRRGDVAGAVKLGGSWFFDLEETRAWVRASAR